MHQLQMWQDNDASYFQLSYMLFMDSWLLPSGLQCTLFGTELSHTQDLDTDVCRYTRADPTQLIHHRGTVVRAMMVPLERHIYSAKGAWQNSG